MSCPSCTLVSGSPIRASSGRSRASSPFWAVRRVAAQLRTRGSSARCAASESSATACAFIGVISWAQAASVGSAGVESGGAETGEADAGGCGALSGAEQPVSASSRDRAAVVRAAFVTRASGRTPVRGVLPRTGIGRVVDGQGVPSAPHFTMALMQSRTRWAISASGHTLKKSPCIV